MTLNFFLLDPDTNQTIKFATYFMNITREDERTTSTLIQSDLFQSRTGNLTIILRHPGLDDNDATQKPLVHGNQEPYLNAWVADSDVITIDNVQLKSSSKYHAHLELFAVDNSICVFPPNSLPNFDLFWSLGSDDEIASKQHSIYVYVPEFTSTHVIFGVAILLATVTTLLQLLNRKRLPI